MNKEIAIVVKLSKCDPEEYRWIPRGSPKWLTKRRSRHFFRSFYSTQPRSSFSSAPSASSPSSSWSRSLSTLPLLPSLCSSKQGPPSVSPSTLSHEEVKANRNRSSSMFLLLLLLLSYFIFYFIHVSLSSYTHIQTLELAAFLASISSLIPYKLYTHP